MFTYFLAVEVAHQSKENEAFIELKPLPIPTQRRKIKREGRQAAIIGVYVDDGGIRRDIEQILDGKKHALFYYYWFICVHTVNISSDLSVYSKCKAHLLIATLSLCAGSVWNG
jgi:hypothetical protein